MRRIGRPWQNALYEIVVVPFSSVKQTTTWPSTPALVQVPSDNWWVELTFCNSVRLSPCCTTGAEV
jgi:hypothetical protein